MLFNLRFFPYVFGSIFFLFFPSLMSTILFIWKVYEMCLHCIYILKVLFIYFIFGYTRTWLLCMKLQQVGTLQLWCRVQALGFEGFGKQQLEGSVIVAQGSRAGAQQLRCTGLVAAQHMGSSQTRDQAGVPCVSRRVLNHWATKCS